MAEINEAERETIRALREQHGAVAAYKVDGQLVVVRKCTVGERDRVKVEAGDKKAVVDKNLVLSCVVHPDLAMARSLLDANPFVYDRAATRIVEISGADVEEVGKD